VNQLRSRITIGNSFFPGWYSWWYWIGESCFYLFKMMLNAGGPTRNAHPDIKPLSNTLRFSKITAN